MTAASDTTAGLLSSLTASIISRPQIYTALISKIVTYDRQGKFSSPVPSLDETNQLPYFNACVKETIRLFPPTPIILPRYVPQGGLHLGNTYLPKHTMIAANPWITNHDKGVFGVGAESFQPARWLESAERTKEMDKYNITFGYGSRKCIGKNLALMEAQKFCLQAHLVLYSRTVYYVEYFGTNGITSGVAFQGLPDTVSEAGETVDL